MLFWHNPFILAEQVATLHVLSGGRVDFGAGKGYRHNEFTGFGISIEESADRFEETLDIVVKSWTSTERFSHQSKNWKFENIVVESPVAQNPIRRSGWAQEARNRSQRSPSADTIYCSTNLPPPR